MFQSPKMGQYPSKKGDTGSSTGWRSCFNPRDWGNNLRRQELKNLANFCLRLFQSPKLGQYPSKTWGFCSEVARRGAFQSPRFGEYPSKNMPATRLVAGGMSFNPREKGSVILLLPCFIFPKASLWGLPPRMAACKRATGGQRVAEVARSVGVVTESDQTLFSDSVL